MMDPDTVVIDVRNFNETVLGKFAPAQVLESSGEGGGEYSVWLCGVDVRRWESAECCARGDYFGHYLVAVIDSAVLRLAARISCSAVCEQICRAVVQPMVFACGCADNALRAPVGALY
jgi:hypothetical protein